MGFKPQSLSGTSCHTSHLISPQPLFHAVARVIVLEGQMYSFHSLLQFETAFPVSNAKFSERLHSSFWGNWLQARMPCVVSQPPAETTWFGLAGVLGEAALPLECNVIVWRECCIKNSDSSTSTQRPPYWGLKWGTFLHSDPGAFHREPFSLPFCLGLQGSSTVLVFRAPRYHSSPPSVLLAHVLPSPREQTFLWLSTSSYWHIKISWEMSTW